MIQAPRWASNWSRLHRRGIRCPYKAITVQNLLEFFLFLGDIEQQRRSLTWTEVVAEWDPFAQATSKHISTLFYLENVFYYCLYSIIGYKCLHSCFVFFIINCFSFCGVLINYFYFHFYLFLFVTLSPRQETPAQQWHVRR